MGLVVLMAIKIGIEGDTVANEGGEVNCYETLGGISKHSTLIEIRAAYKEMGRKYHPDKNHEPGAEKKFMRVKKVYDILMDEKNRDLYNRFGEAALANAEEHEELTIIASVVAHYVFWAVATYLSTVRAAARVSRTWVCLLGIALLVGEGLMRLHNWNVPLYAYRVLPVTTTEHELIGYLHSLFPGVILLLRSIAEYYYVDTDAISSEILLSTAKQLQDFSQALARVQAAVPEGQAGQASKDEIMALRGKMDESNAAITAAMETLKTNNNDPLARYYWYILAGGYALTYL